MWRVRKIQTWHREKINGIIQLKKDNLQDISKPKAGQAMTTAGLHIKVFKDFANLIRRTGAKPHPLILALIKANGKI